MSRTVFEFASELRYAPVDRSVKTIIFNAAQVAKNCLAAKHRASVFCEQGQELELLRGELHFVAIKPDLLSGLTDAQSTEYDVVCVFLDARGCIHSSQQCTRPRQQHHRINRFCDVVICAGLEPDDLIDI